jgi:hypothetical protein
VAGRIRCLGHTPNATGRRRGGALPARQRASPGSQRAGEPTANPAGPLTRDQPAGCQVQTRRRELGGTHAACVCLIIGQHCTARYSLIANRKGNGAFLVLGHSERPVRFSRLKQWLARITRRRRFADDQCRRVAAGLAASPAGEWSRAPPGMRWRGLDSSRSRRPARQSRLALAAAFVPAARTFVPVSTTFAVPVLEVRRPARATAVRAPVGCGRLPASQGRSSLGGCCA